MAQRIVEMVIGRLVTDDGFRNEFLADPVATLVGLSDRGVALNGVEIAALVATDPNLWTRTAESIDQRLQKVSLANTAR